MKSFVDLCEVRLKSGNGGDGVTSFHRSRGRFRIRPDGGNGGDGGGVLIQADSNLTTLYDFTHSRFFKARDGFRGGPNKKKGRVGEDLILKVPVGTVIKESSGTVMVDLDRHGQNHLVVKGGRGGRGNYLMSRVPDDDINAEDKRLSADVFGKSRGKRGREMKYYRVEKGQMGVEKKVTFELKLIADIGIIGLPNAGKTSILNTLTGSKAEVGAYAFTTLNPNLGVAAGQKGTKRVVFADIPGLIEGASEGRGLGDQFLRHIERTKILVHLLDPLGEVTLDGTPNPGKKAVDDYAVVRRELSNWSAKLLDRPEVVVINKVDLTEIDESRKEIVEEMKGRLGIDVFFASSATGEGIDLLMNHLLDLLDEIRVPVSAEAEVSIKDAGQVAETSGRLMGLKTYRIDSLKHYKAR